MSELKAFESERIHWAVEQVEREAGDIDNLHLDDNLFYLKSEADKVIEELKHQRDGAFGLTNSGLTLDDISQMARKQLDHQKYKRCLAMARWCRKLSNVYALAAYTHRGWKIARYYDEKAELYRKWRKHWLRLAEEFKEAS